MPTGKGVEERLGELQEELEECKYLLLLYGADQFGAFPPEVDRFFQRHGVPESCKHHYDNAKRGRLQ